MLRDTRSTRLRSDGSCTVAGSGQILPSIPSPCSRVASFAGAARIEPAARLLGDEAVVFLRFRLWVADRSLAQPACLPAGKWVLPPRYSSGLSVING